MPGIQQYYETYDEWGRLDRHKVEFEVTKRILKKYIMPDSRVLDVGGGPGRYAIFLAKMGNEVTLVDLCQNHVDQASVKSAEAGVAIECIRGNVLDLPELLPGKVYDAVLCMGPLYHLTECKQRIDAVAACLKMLKDGGLFIATFISAFAPIIDCLKSGPPQGIHIPNKERLIRFLSDGRYLSSDPSDSGFTDAHFIHPLEIKGFLTGFGLETLSVAAIEGLGALVEDSLKQLPDAEFQSWLDVFESISEDPAVFGSCEHLIYVGRKPVEDMKSDKNVFRASAHLYDLDQRPVTKDDIPFYIDRAARYPGKVLELACGTGRITIPLAQAGHNVWGIDLLHEMLGQLEKKVSILPQEARRRLTYVHADMCDFNLEEEFSLIFIPFRSFQCLITEEQQNACLERVRAHLADNGRFIINVFKPYSLLDESWIHPEAFDWEVTDPETGCKVKRTDIRRDIDVANQIIYPELVYYITDADGNESRITEPLVLKYYYEGQMRELLIANGFTIEEEMGYYDGRSIKDGRELIFICRKR